MANKYVDAYIIRIFSEKSKGPGQWHLRHVKQCIE